MNLLSQARHLLTGLAGLGTFIAALIVLAPDQVQALNDAGAKLIEPLAIISSIVAVALVRMAMTWASNIFRHGTGEEKSKPSGGVGLLLLACTLTGFLGVSLSACSSSYPVAVAAGYSAKGWTVQAVIPHQVAK